MIGATYIFLAVGVATLVVTKQKKLLEKDGVLILK